ncbi:MAG: ATP-binding cassette domain-containing protein [Campylobacteraceae bacterium]|nr:ATP-binding cassette domain-containing protein [Campylobacteraceae bacterium]
MITLNKETISYKDKIVLNKISLSIKKGEKVALLGKSGSGKSTLLKRLYELNPKDTSYIPQELGLVNSLSVFHNVYISKLDQHSTFYNLRNLIKPIQTQINIISPILEELYMREMMFKKVAELSGGQKQRTAIGRAILQGHNILLADEPISALDEFVTKKVLNSITSKFETIVCALHNVDVALEYYDRVIGIKDGQIVLDKLCSQITSEDTQHLYHVCDDQF